MTEKQISDIRRIRRRAVHLLELIDCMAELKTRTKENLTREVEYLWDMIDYFLTENMKDSEDYDGEGGV